MFTSRFLKLSREMLNAWIQSGTWFLIYDRSLQIEVTEGEWGWQAEFTDIEVNQCYDRLVFDTPAEIISELMAYEGLSARSFI